MLPLSLCFHWFCAPGKDTTERERSKSQLYKLFCICLLNSKWSPGFLSASREESPDSLCTSRAQVLQRVFVEDCCGRIDQAGLQRHRVGFICHAVWAQSNKKWHCWWDQMKYIFFKNQWLAIPPSGIRRLKKVSLKSSPCYATPALSLSWQERRSSPQIIKRWIKNLFH